MIKKSITYTGMREIVECPYCKNNVELDVSEHYEGIEEYECPKCGKNFEVSAEHIIEYSCVEKD